MTTIKIAQILEGTQALREFTNTELPISAALKWNKNVKEIDEVLKVFNERREALFNEWAEEGEADEEGKAPGKVIPKEKMEEFGKLVQELIEEEVELNIQKVDVTTLGNLTMKPAVLAQLEWIFKTE
jgi:hypothetical protein